MFPRSSVTFCCAPPQSTNAFRIACVGDSITSGQYASQPSSAYPGVLQARLGDDFYVENLGACGSAVLKNPRTAPDGMFPVSYWRTPHFNRLQHAGPWDAVVITFGTNDFGFPSTGCRADGTGCPFGDDLAALVNLVRTLGRPGAEPAILLGVAPPIVDTPARRASSYGCSARAWNAARLNMRRTLRAATDVASIIDLLGGPDGSAPLVPLCNRPVSARRRQGIAAPSGLADGPPVPEVGYISPPLCESFCNEQSCDSVHPNDRGNARLAAAVWRGLAAVINPNATARLTKHGRRAGRSISVR